MEEGKHRMIAGGTGSGKSHFTGLLIEEDYKQKQPFIILDTKTRNHIGLAALKQVKTLQIKPGYSYNFERAMQTPFLLCYPSPDMRTKALIEQYDQLLDTIYNDKSRRNIYIEEAHLFNPSPQKSNEWLELFAREGRGYGMFASFITQRIQDFPKLLWSQCGITYLGKFNIPQDIRYVEGIIPNFSDIDRTLKKHDIVRYDHNENGFKVIKAGKIHRITKHYG
ncbi:ATPase [Methanolacinia petrolearia DSM 11571]|uniref:ATPase n=1 Tax=Methanolacinia petrolearia (strain DSM 11571 / OCM 486 / SEBR 4847) TaxID=679926 RepID=E1RD77_METP4|nr:DUF87 domain-containing protein [Methanolacinia petrolearia]ADN37060.1 ATPase [Methanolacinia petrolearia DSM 11571]